MLLVLNAAHRGDACTYCILTRFTVIVANKQQGYIRTKHKSLPINLEKANMPVPVSNRSSLAAKVTTRCAPNRAPPLRKTVWYCQSDVSLQPESKLRSTRDEGRKPLLC